MGPALNVHQSCLEFPGVRTIGPLLFLIYVNDLASLNISVGSQLVLYADDLVLYTSPSPLLMTTVMHMQ